MKTISYKSVKKALTESDNVQYTLEPTGDLSYAITINGKTFNISARNEESKKRLDTFLARNMEPWRLITVLLSYCKFEFKSKQEFADEIYEIWKPAADYTQTSFFADLFFPLQEQFKDGGW